MTDELTWKTATELRQLMSAGHVSPVEVTDHFLARIEEHGPALQAFRHLDPVGARERAKEAEAELRRGDDVGLLHGVPISVKEHLAVAGMPLLGAAAGATSAHDDVAIARIRAAGAVIVGTNSMMGPQDPTSDAYDWDAEAKNPWDTSRVPGWSTTGGAATVAAGLLPLVMCTDGGGSSRLPAAYCGLVGLHPTAGLVPTFNDAVQRRANSTQTVGTIAHDVADAATVLRVIAGPDGRDFDCIQTSPPDYLDQLGGGIDGLRLGWSDDWGCASMYAFEESPRVISHVRDAAKGFAGLGATLDPLDATFEDFFPGYAPTLHLFNGGPPIDQAAWSRAMDLRRRSWEGFREAFAEHDLLVSPTTQLVAATLDDWRERWSEQRGAVPFPHGTFSAHYTSHTRVFNWLGFPAISVPVGLVDGLPVGMQIVGWPGDDAKVLRAGHAFLSAFPREEHPAGWA